MSLKKIVFIAVLSCSHFVFSQNGVETTNVEPSVLLRFPDDGNRGIVLPQVASPLGTFGSILFDNATKTVKYRNNTDWVNLTRDGVAVSLDTTGVTESSSPTIIGSTSTGAQGALVLESTNKALVLPRVANPEQVMVKPQPGTICFDTVSKMIAVYDGAQWSYWK